jgi:hypothetical protein
MGGAKRRKGRKVTCAALKTFLTPSEISGPMPSPGINVTVYFKKITKGEL